ncbi:MAG: NADH-quinone oxidoreductase subunit H [Desulfurivibrio sp.]|nr:MAG: NADH-quinone oxidoreductase subunit H [Desulfurivibrio sp.]
MEVMLTAGLSLATLPVAILLGGLLSGIDRRLTARLQSRQGPPLSQPFFDVLKLLAKERVVTNPWQAFAPVTALGSAALALVLFAAQGDLLVILFVHLVGGVFLVLGALASGSPYSQIAGQRELWQMFCCETLLFLIAGGLYLSTGSFRVSGATGLPAPLLFRLPLLFAAFVFALTVKMRKSPFDLAGCQHAHQELVRGVYTEYVGPHLGLLEIAHWLEVVLYLAVGSLFWATGWGMVLLPLAAFLAVIVLDNIAARLTWRWMLGRGWGVAFVLAAVNLFWLKG